jgi:predicted RNA binding protein YcfA (HicA-like mRNA interferase family)
MSKTDSYDWKKVMSAKDIIKILEKNGWEFVRQKGSHKQYKKNNVLCTIPFHDEIKSGTLSNIKRTIVLAENK